MNKKRPLGKRFSYYKLKLLPDGKRLNKDRRTTKEGDNLKQAFLPILIVLILVVSIGCRSSGPSPSPPKAFVKIGSQKIQLVTNGYKWSEGNSATIADAAFVPARNLKKHNVSPEDSATLDFYKTPNSIKITVWYNGEKVKEKHLNQNSFKLPDKAGAYTYEIIAKWDKGRVNYDFKIQVD